MQTVIIHNEHPAHRYGVYLVNKVGLPLPEEADEIAEALASGDYWETLLVVFGKRQPNNRVIKKALKKKGFLLQ